MKISSRKLRVTPRGIAENMENYSLRESSPFALANEKNFSADSLWKLSVVSIAM